MSGDLGRKTAVGAGMLVLSRLGAKILDLTGLMILTRLLTPADFGLVAIAMTLVQICEAIFELPVTQVLVRSERVTADLLNTAFTLGMARGAMLAAVLLALAWPFGLIYHDPRLPPLISFLALAPTLRGLSSPALVYFTRRMDFRPDVIAEISGKFSALVLGTVVALMTHSYWAIAVCSVASPAFLTATTYIMGPMRPKLRLVEWRYFARFLGWTSVSQLFSAFNWQADRLILGRFVSTSTLGIYTMSSDLSSLPDQALIKPTMRTFLPALMPKVKDPDALANTYLELTCCVFIAVAPLAIVMSGLAEPIIRLVLGVKWLAVAPYLQLLALLLLPPLIYSPLPALAMAKGQPEIISHQTFIECVIKVPLTLAAAWLYGLGGVLVVRAVVVFIVAAIAMINTRRLIPIHIGQVLNIFVRPAIAAGTMAMALWLAHPFLNRLDGWHLLVGLAISGTMCAAIYASTMIVLWKLAGMPSGAEARLIGMAAQITKRLRSRVLATS